MSDDNARQRRDIDACALAAEPETPAAALRATPSARKEAP